MCNCILLLIQMATKVSYHSSFVIQLLTLYQEFNLACLLFHTQWNVVVVIIKCKYLVYPPTCFGINFWLATEVNLKLVQST